MNKDLLLDIYYAAPELWHMVLVLMVVLLSLSGVLGLRLFRLKRNNYFIKKEGERLEETLYASKDGYFAFCYADDGSVLEQCSRRLAVLLNLPAGVKSGIEEVLKHFYKDDSLVISKYISLLREDGVSFEDRFQSKNGKKLILSGTRISGADGSVYSDVVWFCDITRSAEHINGLIKEKDTLSNKVRYLEDLVDNLPYPVWMRNPSLNIAVVNRKYLEFSNCGDKETAVINNIEITVAGDDVPLKTLAKQSRDNNRQQKQSISINKDGERLGYEAVETPFHPDGSLDKIATVGSLVDITDLDRLKRNMKQQRNANLEIMGALGTAFAVFDTNFKLDFYNKAFQSLWDLEENWLEAQPLYSGFLDVLRERRLLPEVPDYPGYKSEEQKMFSAIIEPREDLLHLPDGRSLRRIRSPYHKGGLVFAFEDISERLAARREYNSIVNVQQEILNALQDAVLIFASNGRLKFYNQSYVTLWDADEIVLQKEPTFSELIETQRAFFNKSEDWDSIKKDITGHVFSSQTKVFVIKRRDNAVIECFSTLLPNESIMVLMHKL